MKVARYLLLFSLPAVVTLALAACDTSSGGMNNLGGLTGLGGSSGGGLGGSSGGGLGGSSGGGGGGSGTSLTCPAIIDCIVMCPENDEACAQACFNRGSAPAKTALNSLLMCIDRTNCEGPTQCQQSCPNEFTACYNMGGGGGGGGGSSGGGGGSSGGGSTPTGTLSCQGILSCVNGCNRDTTCVEGCINRGSDAGKSQLNALINCNETKCASGASGCLQQMCAAEVAACK